MTIHTKETILNLLTKLNNKEIDKIIVDKHNASNFCKVIRRKPELFKVATNRNGSITIY